MEIENEQDLFKTLGRIEAKIEGMCTKNKERHKEVNGLTKKIDTKFDNLPCHSNYHELSDSINTKTSGAVFKAVILALFMLICGAFGYTYMIDDNIDQHAQNYDIHYIIPHDNNDNK